MASEAVLKSLVSNGSDLILCGPISQNLAEELASIAMKTGAKLTFSTNLHSSLLESLSAKYGKSITFIDGLNHFKKD